MDDLKEQHRPPNRQTDRQTNYRQKTKVTERGAGHSDNNNSVRKLCAVLVDNAFNTYINRRGMATCIVIIIVSLCGAIGEMRMRARTRTNGQTDGPTGK